MLCIDIAKYLAGQEIGVFDESGVTGSIFVAGLPEHPDDAIAVCPVGGRYAAGAAEYDEPIVRITVRGREDPRVPADKIQAIYDMLHGFRNGRFVPEGSYIVSCLGMESGATYIGRDLNKRNAFMMQFQLRVRNENRRG